MRALELGKSIKNRLEELGSIDTIVWDEIQVSLNMPNPTYARAGVYCLDKNIPELYDNDSVLSRLSCGDEAFALPYGEHIILIFDN